LLIHITRFTRAPCARRPVIASRYTFERAVASNESSGIPLLIDHWCRARQARLEDA